MTFLDTSNFSFHKNNFYEKIFVRQSTELNNDNEVIFDKNKKTTFVCQSEIDEERNFLWKEHRE